jgi:hypothetical protein
MEILRNANTTSLNATFPVSSSGIYTLEYEDLLTGESFSASATSSYGSVTFELDKKYLTYTGNLVASVKNTDGDVVNLSNIDVVVPYCDLESLAVALKILDGSEVNYERIARYIIDSQTQGFKFIRKEKEIIGKGFDYLPVDEKIHKIYKVYENGRLMYDSESENNKVEYKISRDGTSIVEDNKEIPENKMNYKYVWRDRYLDIDFADGYEYVIDGDFGYKVIPQDVQEATELLIQDMKSDSLKYVNRYIESFDNEDFKIKFSKNAGSGSGNIIVDNILEKYKNRFRIGVL